MPFKRKYVKNNTETQRDAITYDLSCICCEIKLSPLFVLVELKMHSEIYRFKWNETVHLTVNVMHSNLYLLRNIIKLD